MDFLAQEQDQPAYQTPLFLAWDYRPFWSALRTEFGGTETTASMILSLVTARGPVSYSRNKNFYNAPARYRSKIFRYTTVTRSADYLGGLGLALHYKVQPGNRGWQSSLQATPQLIERTLGIIGAESNLEPYPPAESIILRNDAGCPVDYRENSDTRQMRNRLAALNEQVRGTLFTGLVPSAMVRIFNQTFNRGGRFYALGGSWQSMSQDARSKITIGGEPVVEIDYKTLHPAILYAQAGATLPEDCYNIQGWPRDLVKVALLILINAKNRPSARLAIAHREQMRSIAEPGSQEAIAAADEIIDLIRSRHRPIARAFYSDKGAELMKIDSDMAETVMHIMMLAGITVLTVHDSFLVQKSQAHRLEHTMMTVAYHAGFEALRVERK